MTVAAVLQGIALLVLIDLVPSVLALHIVTTTPGSPVVLILDVLVSFLFIQVCSVATQSSIIVIHFWPIGPWELR